MAGDRVIRVAVVDDHPVFRDGTAAVLGREAGIEVVAVGGTLDDTVARREAALADYQRTIQTAFREVADALARRGTIDRQLEAQGALEAAARDSAFLAEARYRAGVDSFLSSLDAQRTLYEARRSLASTLRLRAENLVELYRSLGGDATCDDCAVLQGAD